MLLGKLEYGLELKKEGQDWIFESNYLMSAKYRHTSTFYYTAQEQAT